MKIQESAENYLETILIISHKNGFVRNIDIANYLNFSKPSVSVAMKALKNDNYVEIDDSGNITLTKSGFDIAEKVYERHRVIAQALIMLGVDENTAYQDSCKIEHDISDESFEKLKEHFGKYNRI